MELALSTKNESKAFKKFYGKSAEQMPKLIAEGRTPMSTAQLMQRRLDVRNDIVGVRHAWLDFGFDTGDGVVYHPDGRVKVVLDSEDLRDMNSESRICRGALVLTDDDYNALKGSYVEEFERGKLGKVNEWLSKQEAKSHPVWKVLARDQILLNDYVDFIFAECEHRGGHDISEAMGVYLRPCSGDVPELRELYVMELFHRACIVSRYDLGAKGGCFVGLAPEALNLLGKPVGQFDALTEMGLEDLIAPLARFGSETLRLFYRFSYN
jgi:hypothetical protein